MSAAGSASLVRVPALSHLYYLDPHQHPLQSAIEKKTKKPLLHNSPNNSKCLGNQKIARGVCGNTDVNFIFNILNNIINFSYPSSDYFIFVLILTQGFVSLILEGERETSI